MQKTALITGITGQDGYYLARHLADKGYMLYGLVHKGDPRDTSNLRRSLPFVRFVQGDLTNRASLQEACETASPDEIYNLAGQSRVDLSFEIPDITFAVNEKGVDNLLSAVLRTTPAAKIYQASSGEIYGPTNGRPHLEDSPLNPNSPYACSKAAAHSIVKNYRTKHGLFACNGISFNHESPHRGALFVTRKITLAAARISHRLQHELRLGNTSARRDWGFAGDYVPAMWSVLQQDEPDDFIIATGSTYSVEDVLEIAFRKLGRNWRSCTIPFCPELLRPNDVPELYGDPSKAKSILGWQAEMSFKRLIEDMLDADKRKVQKWESRQLTAL